MFPKKILFGFVASSMLLTTLWLGVFTHPEVPEPRWTLADLPSLPPASENGWHAVTSEALDVKIPESLAGLIARHEQDSARYWAQVDDNALLLSEFLSSEGAREASARIEDARRRAAFADACGIAEPCQLFAWHKTHDVALLQALAHAHAGRSTEALGLVTDLLRMDTAQLESARSPISLTVALAQLGEALVEAEMLAARVHGSADASVAAALAELIDEARAVDVELLELRPLLVSEYVLHLKALDASRDAWFYDHALTRRHLDEAFEQRHQGAREGDLFVALGGEQRSPTESFGWWLRNPGGKLVLDSLKFDPTQMVASLEERREAVRVARSRLLARA